jgi:hypothetical protein
MKSSQRIARMKLAQMHMLPLTLLSVLFIVSCSRTPTQPSDTTFSLTVDDASCTEVYLQLRIGSGITSREVKLKRDTVVLFTRTITGTETALTDTSLLPNRTYAYTASVGGNTEHCTATTMDTTSHSFSFTTTSLGDGTGSSTLLDVAIINDTLAYAVGDIYQAGTEYNAAKWNGKTWQLQVILYPYQGQQFYAALHSLFVFAENDLWVGSNQPMHWNGVSWQAYDLSASVWNGWINKMWGNSSSDLYFVGSGGSIVHYNGSTWTKIESGTSLDLRDIYGAQKTGTGAWEVYATAGNPLISPEREVIQISGTTAQAISDIGIGGGLNGLWFSPEQYYWLVGDGIWEKHPTLSDATWHSQTLSSFAIEAVRGNGSNDVFMCGDYGEFLHFNGVSWKSYQAQTAIAGLYAGLAVHGNMVIAVGEANGRAVITTGKR